MLKLIYAATLCVFVFYGCEATDEALSRTRAMCSEKYDPAKYNNLDELKKACLVGVDIAEEKIKELILKHSKGSNWSDYRPAAQLDEIHNDLFPPNPDHNRAAGMPIDLYPLGLKAKCKKMFPYYEDLLDACTQALYIVGRKILLCQRHNCQEIGSPQPLEQREEKEYLYEKAFDYILGPPSHEPRIGR